MTNTTAAPLYCPKLAAYNAAQHQSGIGMGEAPADVFWNGLVADDLPSLKSVMALIQCRKLWGGSLALVNSSVGQICGALFLVFIVPRLGKLLTEWQVLFLVWIL